MKSFKLHHITKKSNKWAGMAFLFLLMMAIGVISCNSDDNGNPNTGGEEPEEGEVETAWVIGYRVETPQGRVYYLEAHENIPSETNTSKAVELGLNSRIYSYGENPYTWNGDAATITKWEVDKSTLELSAIGILSFASTGVSGNIAAPAFISETQAYTTNLAEGVVVEWNPSTMEITKVHNVDAFPDLGVDDLLFEFNKEVTADGKILIPIETNELGTCCDYPTGAAGARTAIFDPETATVTYHVDDRLIGSDNTHFTDPVTGARYCVPVWANSVVPAYFNNLETLPNAHTLLKVNDDGSFDADYAYNLDDILDITLYYTTTFIYDNKLVFTYVGDDYTWGSFDERYNILYTGNFRAAMIDLETNEVQPFDAFSGYTGAIAFGVLDGNSYIKASGLDSDGNETSSLLQQNAIDDYTEVTKHVGGNIEHFNKLW
ncbi:hypothetical protein [Sinomicrobium soli]|uniref:hypothetical protein n=1 Tax=Sinomicrobium sp. N-1-3-6 TaxID=2219864 RepID=UPI000DCC8CDB|nr:hypothetical protein [Sinomicrobium sp. N-1-3-6]RAV30322.1 hypothetical protein DN748_02075 [Sinomicrobium sp. N-1-3-6]